MKLLFWLILEKYFPNKLQVLVEYSERTASYYIYYSYGRFIWNIEEGVIFYVKRGATLISDLIEFTKYFQYCTDAEAYAKELDTIEKIRAHHQEAWAPFHRSKATPEYHSKVIHNKTL